MIRRPSLLLLLAACLTAAQAPDTAAEIAAAYPEGPLLVEQTVLFAEMHRDRVTAWDGDHSKTFYKSAGCGPTAIAPYADGYAVLCHRSNEIHLITRNGTLRSRLDRDNRERSFLNPNDASADGHGGVWFTASGVFDRTAPNKGALLYLDAGGKIRRVERSLAYANGVHFDKRRRLLFVTEHLGRRIRAYPERAPGRLGRPATFSSFDETGSAPGGTELTGPDGLESDEKGNLYVALYGAGQLFILGPDGATLFRLAGQEPLITNVAVDGCELIITGARRAARPPFPGSVRRIANPICHIK
jgi:gluconolactonase